MSEYDNKLQQRFNIDMANLKADITKLNTNIKECYTKTEQDINENPSTVLAEAVKKLTYKCQQVSDEYQKKITTIPDNLSAHFRLRDKELIDLSSDKIGEIFSKQIKTTYKRQYGKEVITAFIVSNLLTFTVSMMVAYKYFL